MDRPQVDVVDLEMAKIAFDMGERLVGIDPSRRVEVVLFDGGAQHVDPVEGSFLVNGVPSSSHDKSALSNGDLEVLGHLELVDHLADFEPDLVGADKAAFS